MNYLSPKLISKNSLVAGHGLFAGESISMGEIILDLGVGKRKIINAKEADRLYAEGFDYMIQIDDHHYAVTVQEPDSIAQGYINHSCDPNCGIKNNLQVVAMRDICSGEEISFDYAMSESSDYSMKCACGSPVCRKVITGEDWKLPALQRKYAGYFSDYLRQKQKSHIILKKLFIMFLIGFALNLVWEFSHSTLYVSYRGGEITNLVLFRAAVWDAVIILVLTILAYALKANRPVFVVVGGAVVSIMIELWALETGRWVYDAAMPIIPILNTGFTSTIQLALTGYIAVRYTFKVKSNKP